MPDDVPRETAWFAVHDALPAYWQVGPVTFDPGRGMFMVTARAPHPGRGKSPVTVPGAGDTEIAALVDLHARLTGMPRPADDAAKREVLNRRLRQAFYQGAEEEAASRGRQLDNDELGRVLDDYPGTPRALPAGQPKHAPIGASSAQHRALGEEEVEEGPIAPGGTVQVMIVAFADRMDVPITVAFWDKPCGEGCQRAAPIAAMLVARSPLEPAAS